MFGIAYSQRITHLLCFVMHFERHTIFHSKVICMPQTEITHTRHYFTAPKTQTRTLAYLWLQKLENRPISCSRNTTGFKLPIKPPVRPQRPHSTATKMPNKLHEIRQLMHIHETIEVSLNSEDDEYLSHMLSYYIVFSTMALMGVCLTG